MRALDRKLVRDVLQMKGQTLAISLVIAAGVATFVMSLSMLESLERSRDTYYDRYRFAEVFANMKRAPRTLEARIAEIPGVARVQTRVVVDVTLDVEGLDEPAVGRIISVPGTARPVLNDVYLRSGRYIEPGRPGEVLVTEAFAEAHGLREGDTVRAIINARRELLKIVGIVLSPEYVLQVRAGELLPDPTRFGVFWMDYDQLAPAYDMDGAFNDVTLALMRGASEAEVIRRLDDLTARYGGAGAYGREDQLSNRFLSDEMQQLRGMAMVAPTIFLAVAAFLLNVVLSRLISTQREQIAAIKAFGYTKWEVGLHYFKLTLAIVAVGDVLGIIAGYFLGRDISELYTQFYKFPVLQFHLALNVVFLAVLISGGAAVVGTFAAVAHAVRLPPAEAMRPEPPAEFRPTVVERMGLSDFLPQAARMILRQLERRPLKSALSSLGIAMAVAVLVLGSFGEDAINYMMEFQFFVVQRDDMTISFVEPTTGRVLNEVGQLPGVMYAEPFRAIPVRLRHGHRSRRVGIMGIEPDGELFRLIDEREMLIPLPPEGMVLSQKLAELLGIELGDQVTVEVLEGNRPVREVPVTGVIADFAGLSAYMDIGEAHRLMREGPTLSGAYLSVDSKYRDRLYQTLKETPRVAGVAIKTAALETFRDTIAENLLRMRTFNIIFASIIAFGVVYNSARISLSERSRELATLRVIGFTRGEISAILLGELAVLTAAAIPGGLLLGFGFAWFVSLSLDTEVYRIPLVVDSRTYAFAATVVIIATIISGLIVRRRLDHLDLVEVLKTRE